MDYEAKLKEILVNIDDEIDVESLTRETQLKEQAGLTSVALLYMAVAIEDEFGVDLANSSIGDLKTIGDVIDAIEAAKK